MNFIITAFTLACTSVKNKVWILIVSLCIAVCSTMGIAYTAHKLLDGDAFKLNVGIVNLDTNGHTESLLNFLLKHEEVNSRFVVETVDSLATLQNKVRLNEIVAGIVLPADFLNGVLTGQNMPLQVVLSDTPSLEKSMIYDTIDSLSHIMVDTQSGIYTTLLYLHQNNAFSEEQILPINLEYISTLLYMLTAFSAGEITYTNSFSLEMHYIICFTLYFLLLSTAIFYDEFHAKTDLALLRLVKTVKDGYALLYFMKLLVLATVYFAIFVVLLYCLKADFDLPFLLAILTASCFFICIQSLIFNLVSNHQTGIQINFCIHTLCLVISGGIVPSVFLPDVITKLEWLSPISYMKELISSGFVYIDTTWYMVGMMSINCVILFYLHTINQNLSQTSR